MKRIAVLGLGPIGGPFALALRQAGLAEHIAAYDVDPETTRRAKECGAITHVSDTAMEVVRQADLVILATPILALPELFKRIAPALTPGTLVTDVASIKAQGVEWADRSLPPHIIFVGGHPMAGIEAAEAGLFAGCIYCFTPTTHTA